MAKIQKSGIYKICCRVFYLVMLCFLLLHIGCARQQTLTEIEESLQDTAKADFMQTIEKILVDMHFSIDKADIEHGLIRTRPLPGAQFFELWRSDNTGYDNWAISNLHSVRRTVEITLTEDADTMSVSCIVHLERLSLPGRQIDSSARAYEMFTTSGILMQTLLLNPGQVAGMQWIDLGRDLQLEKTIMTKINNKLLPPILLDTTMEGSGV